MSGMSLSHQALLFSLLPPSSQHDSSRRSAVSRKDDNDDSPSCKTTNTSTGISSLCFLGPCLALTTDSHSQEDDEEEFLNQLQSRARLATALAVPQRTQQSTKDAFRSASTSTALLSSVDDLHSCNKLLASCQVNGNAFIWDLTLRRIACPVLTSTDSRASSPGLTLQRSSSLQFLYQTRDPLGCITFHDVQHSNVDSSAPSIVQTFHSYSQSFCPATVHGPSHILAYPTQDTQHVELRDFRISPFSSSPIARIAGAPVSTTDTPSLHPRGHGMITSLSTCYIHHPTAANTNKSDWSSSRDAHAYMPNACTTDSMDHHSGRLVLACGMESGSIFFHDLAMLGGNRDKAPSILLQSHPPPTVSEHLLSRDSSFTFSSISLGNFPIFGLDMASSSTLLSTHSHHPSYKSNKSVPNLKDMSENHSDSVTERFTKDHYVDTEPSNQQSYPFVAIAGLAADAESMLDLPPEDRGTVAVIKGAVVVSTPSSHLDADRDKISKMNEDRRCHDARLSASSSSSSSCHTTTHPTSTIVTRIRARVGTCRINDSTHSHHIGKPGVNTCRFHPQGRIFAVGGWDRRIRIYSRTSARPLAVLRENNTTHEASITALDWSTPITFPVNNTATVYDERNGKDCLNMSLLASGNSEGRISLYYYHYC